MSRVATPSGKVLFFFFVLLARGAFMLFHSIRSPSSKSETAADQPVAQRAVDVKLANPKKGLLIISSVLLCTFAFPSGNTGVHDESTLFVGISHACKTNKGSSFAIAAKTL